MPADLGNASCVCGTDAALTRHSVIVRPLDPYGLPHILRITVGTDEECGLVVDALAGFMATQAAHA